MGYPAPFVATKRVSVDEVPQEITDLIVDCIANDFTALKASALLSRQWRSRSQYHLHHTLTIGRQSDLPLLESIYSDPILGDRVRSLHIERMWSPFWRKIIPVIEKLNAVHSLTLAYLGGITLGMQHLITSRFPLLESLSLSYVSFEDFFTLTNFLNTLPNLKKLKLSYVYWSRSTGTVFAASVHHLRELDVSYCTEQVPLLEWLMAAGDNLELERLAISWYQDPASIQAFLHTAGKHLQSFTFSYVPSDANYRGVFVSSRDFHR